MHNLETNERFIEIKANLEEVQQEIIHHASQADRNPEEITLIVVTKNFPVSDIEILYALGQRDFGENKEQELVSKVQALKHLKDIRWHFIGQLQSRKVSSVISCADVIHSVDREKIIQKIENQNLAEPYKIFLQVNLDETRDDRGGVSVEDLPALLHRALESSALDVQGLMCVLPQEIDLREGFEKLEKLFLHLSQNRMIFSFLSAGMSQDYKLALSFSATHLRVGSQILGKRITSG